MSVEVLPTAVDLDGIAEQVWVAFLDGGNELVIHSGQSDDTSELSASVGIVGAYEGHVVVSCSQEASRDVASALFAMPSEEVTDDEIGDALGELANVLGGNVKSMLPAPSTMSLPTVAGTKQQQWPGTTEVCRTMVTWRGNPFNVTLLVSRNN
ncbi:MAG TPA: chemotaxis protein CheX [Actinophytocola sp.]|uniref:chemotaxis protein CheX n=1 Tax=Actinophytocola sp. TaxID=1872138 RepID=UPI002DB7AA82|nr:chemotaxis protein CheX [Actinophytocola sp.]HEU5474238.1 chemotaxis protein CheX [Actinophytocola sp.]